MLARVSPPPPAPPPYPLHWHPWLSWSHVAQAATAGGAPKCSDEFMKLLNCLVHCNDPLQCKATYLQLERCMTPEPSSGSRT